MKPHPEPLTVLHPATTARRQVVLGTFGGVALLALLVLGCQDSPQEPTRAAAGPVRPALSEATTDDSAPGCPLAFDIALRQVDANHGYDVNGNGYVCDRNDGSPDYPIIVTHDDFMAATPE